MKEFLNNIKKIVLLFSFEETGLFKIGSSEWKQYK